MRVRPARSADVDVWVGLRSALEPQTDVQSHRAEVTRRLGDRLNGACFFCIDDDDRVLGFAEVSVVAAAGGYTGAATANLEALYVRPEVRRQGGGRLLLEAAESWAAERRCRRLGSTVDLDDKLSQLVHQTLGFEEQSRNVRFAKSIEVVKRETLRPVQPLVPRTVEPSIPLDTSPRTPDTVAPATPSQGAWGWRIAHLVVLVLGVIAFVGADISSPDVLEGALFPAVVALSAIYLGGVLVVNRYRAKTDERNRRGVLFDSDES